MIKNGVVLQASSKAFELFQSKDKKDHKKAQRLMAYCDKAEKCNYNVIEIRKLRQEFNDVL